MKALTIPFIFTLLTSSLGAENREETKRQAQLENEKVRIWKTTIAPHQPLKMHRHDHPRVVVGLKGGKVKKIEKTGEESDLIFETGKAIWLDKDPEGTEHADINLGDHDIEVMVIEFKQ